MNFWYKKHLTWQARLLLPIAKLVEIYTLRKRNNRASESYSVPVIVVGNITVGGTGKTPMIIWLARELTDLGLSVAVVSRGYGAKPNRPFPVEVAQSDLSEHVGDEPKLIQSLTNVRVVIDPQRDHAVKFLLDGEAPPDIIISDDGMQHYAMYRDLEILMLDGDRFLGNEHLLPAGPLREPSSRLESVDFKIVKVNDDSIIVRNDDWDRAVIKAGRPINQRGEILDSGKVILCSGIGNFNSFRQSAKQMGFEIVKEFRFKDHEAISKSVLEDQSSPILVTEKDMIKLSKDYDHVFALPIELQLSQSTRKAILKKIEGLKNEKSRHYSSEV